MGESDISWEKYIPTDKWSLQDWYLSRLVRFDSLYSRILKSRFSSSIDVVALVSFFSLVMAYHVSARQNMQHHMKDKYVIFVELINIDAKDLHKKEIYEPVDEIMLILSDFHWNSGLSKLSESRAMGTFAKARAGLGMKNKEDNDELR